MVKTILIPMGDWCGSTTVDLTDQIEATGAGEGKQRKRRLNKMLLIKRKKFYFFVGEGVFSLDPHFNGRPHSCPTPFSSWTNP
jgi:hypothetical protein